MGSRGPAPKRSSQRRRTNEPATKVVSAPAGAEVVVPEPSESWHPIARSWYDSLSLSGQSVFYENSDWQSAYVLAESMSREFKPQPIVVGDDVQFHEAAPKAASIQAWMKGFAQLLATEGERRRVGLELQRVAVDQEEDADGVAWIDDARNRLRSG